MYRIVDSNGKTVAITTRLEDARAMIQTLKNEPQLKIVVDNTND